MLYPVSYLSTMGRVQCIPGPGPALTMSEKGVEIGGVIIGQFASMGNTASVRTI